MPAFLFDQIVESPVCLSLLACCCSVSVCVCVCVFLPAVSWGVVLREAQGCGGGLWKSRRVSVADQLPPQGGRSPQRQAASCVCWMHLQGVGMCVCAACVCMSLLLFRGVHPPCWPWPCVVVASTHSWGQHGLLSCGGQLESAAQHSTVHACTTHCSKLPAQLTGPACNAQDLGAATLRP